jgi:hypothetical protein
MLNHSKISKCIVVTGMHRSGTSALMGVLHRLGVDLGSNYLNPSDDNPRGFFENYNIVQINENILNSFNSSWDDIFPLPDEWWTQDHVQQYKQEIIEIVRQQMGDEAIFGIKDPRISRLFPLWNIIFGELSIKPCFIIPLRNPLEVADSLSKRNMFPVEKSLLLWMTYMLDAERYSRTCSRMFMEFDDLLDNAEKAVGTISRAFDLAFPRTYADIKDDVEGFLDGALKHHSTNMSGPEKRFIASIFDYYRALRELAHTETGIRRDLSGLDTAANDFLRSYRLFYNRDIAALHGQLKKATTERDRIALERDAAVRERDNLSATLDAIYRSNFWKMADRYYDIRDSVPLFRSAYRLIGNIKRFFSRSPR